MDGYHELSKEEIEQDEQRRKSIQKTPVHVSMEKATPTSTTSLPVGSVKKVRKRRFQFGMKHRKRNNTC